MVTQDWKVGYKLWQKLTDALKDQITETRKKAMPTIDNGDCKPPSSVFRKPPPQGPARGNSDVIKAPTKPGSIPNQDNTNVVTHEEEEKDEDVQTFLSYLSNARVRFLLEFLQCTLKSNYVIFVYRHSTYLKFASQPHLTQQ